MAEPISDEEKSVKKSSSFTKFLRSPARSATNSPKKSSSNPLSKLLLRRKSSRRGEYEDEGGSNSARRSSVDSEPIDEEEETTSLTEDVKQVVDSAIDRVFHNRDNHDSSFKQSIDPSTIISQAKDEFSSVVAESKESEVDKFKEELAKAEEDLKKEYTKAEEEWQTQHVEPSHIVQRVQEEEVATEINSKEGTSSPCCQGGGCKEKDNVEKKEENCVATLALGLQKLCAPWSLKKED